CRPIGVASTACLLLLLSPLVLDPSSIGKHNRRLDLPFRDRPVGPQQVIFVALRNDDESVPPIEVDRPRRIGPGADQYRLAREIFDMTKKLCTYALPLRRGRNVRVSHEGDGSLVLNSHYA